MDLSRIVEEKILAAMQAGEFDRLEGHGKPLELELYPFEGEDARLANHVLRANNMVFPWMETGKDIETAISDLRSQPAGSDPAQFRQDFLSQINSINHSILDYNLRVPVPVLQKPVLDFETEFKRISG